MSVARYFHTLRHLRPIQFGGRVWKRLYRPPPDASPAQPTRSVETPWPGPFLRRPSLLDDRRVSLLGEAREITAPGDWQHAHPAMLWMFNLHYFDDLNADGDAEQIVRQRSWIEAWLAANPPGVGVGWEPYPTSLRIVSWIRWLARGHEPVAGMVQSLAVQARYLRQRLEHHLLGNHLFVNAKALMFAGALFTGAEAAVWLRTGTDLVRRELGEQILPDGGQFERSPMYHALALEDVLDLIALDVTFPGLVTLRAVLRASARQMVGWLLTMTHPDGDFALFNDAAFGVAARPSELSAYASTLGIAAPTPAHDVIDLPDSGYTRVARCGAVMFTDTGAIGPDYLPGHGHADTLGFELSVRGRRIFVDSGVSEYGTSTERLRQRGTRAHNTIVVDGQDSSEVWSGFRVARRARIAARQVDVSPEVVTIHAEHDGYRRLRGSVIHRRTWTMSAGSVVILDELRGSGVHDLEIAFHFAPGLEPRRAANNVWTVVDGIQLDLDPKFIGAVGSSSYHPEFGANVASSVVRGSCRVELPVQLQTTITWT